MIPLPRQLLSAVALVGVLAVPAAGQDRPAGDEPAPDRAWLREASFSIPRASYFYAALGIPPLESARTVPDGTFLARLRTTHAHSKWKWTTRPGLLPNGFDGTYHEWASLQLAYGITDRLEVGAQTVLSGWDEHLDEFNLFDPTGQRAIVFGEGRKIYGLGATKRHENVTKFGAHVKGRLLKADEVGVDLSLELSCQFPFGRARDLTNAGTYDLGATLQLTLPTSWGALHLNVGGVFPLGETTLFQPQERIDLHPFVQAAAGVTFTITDTFSLGLQVATNTTAFQEVDVLSEVPVSATLGLRKQLGEHWFLEGGGGIGLSWRSTYRWLGFASLTFVI